MAIAIDAGMSPVTMAVAWSKQHDFVPLQPLSGSAVRMSLRIFSLRPIWCFRTKWMKAINKVSREIMYPMG